jgi:hypothetical protein
VAIRALQPFVDFLNTHPASTVSSEAAIEETKGLSEIGLGAAFALMQAKEERGLLPLGTCEAAVAGVVRGVWSERVCPWQKRQVEGWRRLFDEVRLALSDQETGPVLKTRDVFGAPGSLRALQETIERLGWFS